MWNSLHRSSSPTHLKTILFEGIFLRFNRNTALTFKNYNYLHKFIFKFFCSCWVPDRMEIWVIHHWSTRVFGGTHWKIKTKNILIMCSNCFVKPERLRYHDTEVFILYQNTHLMLQYQHIVLTTKTGQQLLAQQHSPRQTSCRNLLLVSDSEHPTHGK